jgi:hypothetical protein
MKGFVGELNTPRAVIGMMVLSLLVSGIFFYRYQHFKPPDFQDIDPGFQLQRAKPPATVSSEVGRPEGEKKVGGLTDVTGGTAPATAPEPFSAPSYEEPVVREGPVGAAPTVREDAAPVPEAVPDDTTVGTTLQENTGYAGEPATDDAHTPPSGETPPDGGGSQQLSQPPPPAALL